MYEIPAGHHVVNGDAGTIPRDEKGMPPEALHELVSYTP